MKKIDVWKRKTAKEQRKRADRQEKVSKLLGLRPTMMIIDDPIGSCSHKVYRIEDGQL